MTYDGDQDEGFVSPALVLVAVVLVVLAAGLLQIGASAERSSRVQIAADAAALAAAEAAFDVDGDGVVTPGAGSASAPELPPSRRALLAAQEYAELNLPGVDPDDVTIAMGANRVAVEIIDRREVVEGGPIPSREPRNIARATAAIVVCPGGGGSPSNPGCPGGVRSARLVR